VSRDILNGLLLLAVALPVCRGGPAAETEVFLFSSNQLLHVRSALDLLNMTESDLGFEKDVGEPIYALPRLRGILGDPLDLPRMAGEVLTAAKSESPEPMLRLATGLLDSQTAAAEKTASGSAADAAASFEEAVDAFCRRAATARELLSAAFKNIPPSERQFAAAVILGGIFDMDDSEDVQHLLRAGGIPGETVEDVRRDWDAVDPEPAATRLLRTVESVDLAAVTAAAQTIASALDELQAVAALRNDWPSEPVLKEVASISVRIGTPLDDVHRDPAMLLLEPGGNDLYTGAAANADGISGRPLCVVLDLDGDDRYMGPDLLGAGAALFGLCLVRDVRGDDTYRARYAGQGAAIFGAARLEDLAGNDFYDAQAFAQAAAFAGIGMLNDAGGRDAYEVGCRGQGYAGVRGVGILVDRDGADVYVAGRRRRDYGRYGERYLSLAQGFSIGMRPFAGGGIGALVDLEGNDLYRADVFGQGVSYWYSAGLLLDCGGHDSYDVHEYGQGSGIHLSAGLLYDASGDDRYYGHSLSQGNAHDYAVGMLLDRSGNDTYTADHYSQGRGINNSFGLLLDAEGSDAYFGRRPDSCQGIGHDGGRREYGCIGLLLDLAGEDRYTCGAADGARLVRPDFGMVYDVKE